LACRKTGKLLIGPPQPLGLPASNLPEFGAISRDGRTLAAADRSYGELFIYDLIKRRLLFRGPHANPSRIAISSDCAWVVGGTWSDHHPAVRRWNTKSQEQVDHWPGPNGTMLAFSPNGRWLWAGASHEGRLVDVNSWEKIRSSRIEAGGTGAGVFSPDSSMLAVNASSDRVQLVDPSTGEEIASFEASIPLCFTREGNLLLTQQDDQTVHLWDLAAIRRQLASLNLDWSGPSLPPAPQDLPGHSPLLIRVLSGQMQ
jgi:WD40 repeat protein